MVIIFLVTPLLLLTSFFQLISCSSTIPRCFLEWEKVDTQLPDLCGCTGVSPAFNMRYNIILPPHSGTGTLTMVLGRYLKVRTCVHEHTNLAVHYNQTSKIDDYCKMLKSKVIQQGDSVHSESTKLCSAIPDRELLVVIARNPFQRLVTGLHFTNEERRIHNTNYISVDKLSKKEQIDKFRAFVKFQTSMDTSYIKPLTEMITTNDGKIIYPDFVINNLNTVQYLEDLNNLIRIFGYGSNDTIANIRKSVNSGYGHYISKADSSNTSMPATSSISITLEEYFDEITTNVVLERYKDDFEMFNFERNVTKIV